MILKLFGAIILIAFIAIIVGAFKYGLIMNPSPTTPTSEKSIYEFTMKDIDGRDISLNTYRGKVLMVVNVASKCGFTPQYEGLEELFNENKDNGFVILGFPANNFMGQEPGTEAEIKELCSTQYNVTFPMFSKISVTGIDQHPLYNFLTNNATNPEFGGDISWNFNKFLIDRDGGVVARFGSKAEPGGPEIKNTVEKYLAIK